MTEPLSLGQCLLLANLLPDGPQTVISRAHLRRGTARAYAVGLSAAGFAAVVVEDPGCPGEPMVFGHDPGQIASLVPHIPNWFCLNVDTTLAPKLAPLLAERLNRPVHQLVDIYHVLNRRPPATYLSHPAVRRLIAADLPWLLAAPQEVRGFDPEYLVREAAVAGAVMGNQIVAIAQNYALTEGYGDIGVYTLPAWRGQDLATAAAAHVARWLQQNGRTPVWSCGEHNLASRRVAEKLGFVENGRRVYIILPEENTADS